MERVGCRAAEIALDDRTGAGRYDSRALHDLAQPQRTARHPAGECDRFVLRCEAGCASVEWNGEVVLETDLADFAQPNLRPDGAPHQFSVAYCDDPGRGYIGLQTTAATAGSEVSNSARRRRRSSRGRQDGRPEPTLPRSNGVLMSLALKSLILKRFRSMPAERVTLSNPTFLVGQNGSGKSNLVDAFAFLAEAMVSPLQAVFDRRGGISLVRNRSSGKSYPPNLGLGVELSGGAAGIRSAHYAFEVAALKNYGFEVVREQCVVERPGGQRDWFERQKGSAPSFRSSAGSLNPAVEPSALALPLIGGDARFHDVFRFLSAMRVYAIEPAKLREMQDPDAGTSLRSDGSNAASVLQEIERQSADSLQRICELLETIVPKTTRVQAKKHGTKLSLEFTQEWGDRGEETFEAFSMSDGTLRALGLLTAVYQQPPPSVLVVEEPEATIHPGALGAVLDLLRHASRQMQVVVTTHSPELLDARWIDDSQLRIVSWEAGATRISEISQASREALQRHLMGAGELLRSNALTSSPDLFQAHDAPQLRLFDEEPV